MRFITLMLALGGAAALPAQESRPSVPPPGRQVPGLPLPTKPGARPGAGRVPGLPFPGLQAAPPSGAKQDRPVWVELDKYTESISRAAFAACDRDGDDRLSIFEAAAALEAIESIRDTPSFRRLDANADGFLEWPEFDKRFRELTARGDKMRIQPAHPFDPDEVDKPAAPVVADTEPSALVAQIIALLDTDQDGVVTNQEAEAKLRASGVPKPLIAQVAGLDANRSGDLTGDELAPLAALLPGGPAVRTPAPKEGQLPPEYARADLNGDGVLDRAELNAALLEVDPSLSRWIPRIVRDADKTRNGTLGPLEISEADNRDATTR